MKFGWKFYTCSAMVLLAVGIIATASLGILGHYQYSEDCLVTSCENKTVFYNSKYIPVAHIKMQYDRVEEEVIKETNGEVYYLQTDCTKVPKVIDGFFHKGECRCKRGCCDPDEMWGVREWGMGWIAFFFVLAIPIGIFSAAASECGNNCHRCRISKQTAITLAVAGFVYGALILTLIITGGMGFIDIRTELCLKSACVLESTVKSNYIPVPKITINTTKFNEKSMPIDLLHTYYNYTARSCSDIPSLITCHYRYETNTISVDRVPNELFLLAILLLVAGCGILWGFSCCYCCN